ncbi:DedA family protein [Micromonospora sp. DT227]|uniref:DedA family protein n=1 Tax=Micromonospora sp. DT227 TaxID=3393433 RepID=UPI003CF96737
MLAHLMHLAGSPWIYVLTALVVMVDGIFPVLPSDSLTICLSALAVAGRPHPVGLLVAAAAGSVAADHLAYLLGRSTFGRLRGIRVGALGAALAGAERALERRGGVALLIAHFLPGGRTAATLAAGSVGFPLRRFLPVSVLAGVLWSLYMNGLGRLGGMAFADHPLIGAIPGIVLGAAVAVVLQVRARRAARRAAATADPPRLGVGARRKVERREPVAV